MAPSAGVWQSVNSLSASCPSRAELVKWCMYQNSHAAARRWDGVSKWQSSCVRKEGLEKYTVSVFLRYFIILSDLQHFLGGLAT